MQKSQYDKKRLTSANIIDYLKEQYGSNAIIKSKDYYKIPNIKALLQKDYGKDNDCTITSLTTCLFYRIPEKNPQEIYNIVEAHGEKNHFYNGKLYGTIPIFIKCIYDKCLKTLGINLKSKSAYFKGIGYSFEKLKTILKKQTPIILSIPSDGRDYYSDHSITVIGYVTYLINETESADFLLVYDNWSTVVSYVDFKKINVLSCINYL